MEPRSRNFVADSARALVDPVLRGTLAKLAGGFPDARRDAVSRLPEFDAICDAARAVKDQVLDNLDAYLERFEERVIALDGHVHWCRDAAEARDVILAICRGADARTVTKSKSMICEEIAINEHLEAHGIEPVETDLGEYIIQLRREPPSHIIAPAIHLTREHVAETFRAHHDDLAAKRSLEGADALLEEARSILRRRFHAADVGITGANMLVAETGAVVTVTNEGNAELTMTLPRVHVVVASIEKVVPTLADAVTILRVLARSATGQDISVYTTFAAGPRRPGDADGPESFHVVLLDNGRSVTLGSEFRDILRCIRCGACLNHCPVYAAVGGHAYGWVYSGPMGAVLTPSLIGIEHAPDLPDASSLCGRCEEVCPMRIPLPALLRRWRERRHGARIGSVTSRWGLAVWAFVARRPALYRLCAAAAAALLELAGRRKGRLRRLPFGGGWTDARDLPAPEGRTFMRAWRAGDHESREPAP